MSLAPPQIYQCTIRKLCKPAASVILRIRDGGPGWLHSFVWLQLQRTKEKVKSGSRCQCTACYAGFPWRIGLVTSMMQFHVCLLLLLPASSWRSPRTQSHGQCQSQYPATKQTTSEQNTTGRVNSKTPHIQTKKKLLEGHKQQSQFSSITMTSTRSSSRHGPVSKDYGPLLLWPWKNVKVTKINIQCRTQWRLSPCRI